MKVAFLGPEGTYTHQAAEKYFSNYEPVPVSTITEAVESDAKAAVIPFENSLGGGVTESIDLLRERDVEVTGQVKVEIDHVLASKEGNINDVEKVRSHPQALTQSKKIIGENGWEKKESSSTAKAAEEIEEGEAAICSKLAAQLNDLNILEESVQDRESNTTRFFILNGKQSEGSKTSMIVEPGEDRPGLLGSMLSCFSGHGINLAYIQSRPTKDGLGNYFFYIEAEADQNSEKFENTKKCLETYAEVKVLGSFGGKDA
ncbi:MAG: prephenate dehydratase [Nanohaloarchaea archaeon]|nr:prephenate dehydratase [Candidatus Nanohaloarchaea archaeon]